MVETSSWEILGDKSIKIRQNICVERQSHKLIVVGKNGNQIKSISQAARKEIEKLVAEKTHLFLRVKVDKEWGERKDYFLSLGLKYDI